MKEKFLKDLEKKLNILSDEERKDTINEYEDIINEKIKHGETEEKAIKEFGDIDELVDEILKAYKINPDFTKNKFTKQTTGFIKSLEKLIEKISIKLSDFTNEIADLFNEAGKDLNASSIFEIIIKIILVLLCLALLKIPFYVISGIGAGIFGIDSLPLSNVGIIIWKILVELAYIASCIFLIISFVHNYTKSKSEDKSIKTDVEKKKTYENNIKNNKVQHDGFTNFLLLLVKIWCIIIILIPLWCIQIGILIGICAIIYFLFKGVMIYGFLILFVGILGLLGYISNVIWKLIFSRKEIHIYPVFISIILIVIGSIMSFEYVSNIKFIKTMPENINLSTKIYNIELDNNTYITNYVSKEIDESLPDNIIKFEISYVDDIYDINEPIKEENVQKYDINGDDNLDITDVITINYNYKDDKFSFNNRYTKLFLDNLKNNKIYDYTLLDRVNIKVYSNSNTVKLYN